MQVDPIVIVGARRTPMGAFQGALSAIPAPKLGGHAIAAALAQSGVAAVAGDDAVVHVDDLVLARGQPWRRLWRRRAERHGNLDW